MKQPGRVSPWNHHSRLWTAFSCWADPQCAVFEQSFINLPRRVVLQDAKMEILSSVKLMQPRRVGFLEATLAVADCFFLPGGSSMCGFKQTFKDLPRRVVLQDAKLEVLQSVEMKQPRRVGLLELLQELAT